MKVIWPTFAAIYFSSVVMGSAEAISSAGLGASFEIVAKEGRPSILSAAFGTREEFMESFDFGTIYLSCYSGRTDIFRLNLVLVVGGYTSFDKSPKIFLGTIADPKGRSVVIESRKTEISDAPPPEFGFIKYNVAFPKLVQDYDEYGVSDSYKLYVTSYADADLLQSLRDSQNLELVAYNEESKTYSSMVIINYHLSDDASKSFLVSCLNN